MSQLSIPLRRAAALVLLLFAAGTLPLLAQLDPRLQKGTTDFLDLFQKSNALQVKPEVVTILDFSGSMNALMWHPNYYANVDENNHLPYGYAGGDDTWVRPYVTSLDEATGPKVNFVTYRNGARYYETSPFLTDGTLVKADGTDVVKADVLAQPGNLGKTNDATNWIRVATHVRITMTHPISGKARQLDLPIPWTIFDSPSGIPSNSPSYSTSSAPDPQNANAATPFDTTASDPTIIFNQGDTTGYFGNSPGLGWIGHFWYNRDYTYWLFFGTDKPNDPNNPTGSVDTGSYIIPDSTAAIGKAFQNGIPVLARFQGVKRAVIMTWLANQTQVYWAYRYLDYKDEQGLDNVDPSNTNAPNPASGSNTRKLQLFTKASGGTVDPSVKALEGALPIYGTPLTYAFANALAQLNVDKNSVFDSPHTSDKYISPQCQSMFVVLFTDGIANDAYGGGSAIGTGKPYLPGSIPAGSSNAEEGNKSVNASGVSTLNPGQVNFNTWTLAGVAAHGADPTLTNKITIPSTYPTSTAQAPQYFAPFFIKSRGSGTSYSVNFTTPRAIQTMTVGVSLAGGYTDTSSGKFALLATAASGDPSQNSWNLSTAVPYTSSNKNTYFFDARDPNSLAGNIGSAITEIINIANKQATSAPSIPFVGVGLAQQVYIGQFTPDAKGGPIWTGDLMMFPTQTTQGINTTILDNSGNPLTNLDAAHAGWSAAASVQARPWSSRTIYTRIPATSSVPTPGLVAFTDKDPGFSAIKTYLPSGLTDAQKQTLIQFILGADTTSTQSPLPNRSTIMGDIVDSIPLAVEYSTIPSNLPPGPLTSAAASHPLSSGAHFRVIFVGNNQGLLEAFGELSWTTTTTNASGQSVAVAQGVVDELWAYLPTDFLPYLNYFSTSTNPHRFTVDGSPFIYTLDLPASGAVAGNGMVDPTETAIMVFGLRKGGRSYYALDVHDPMKPALKWVVNPDEASTIPSGRILSGSSALIGKMGFSTAGLIPGRVLYGGNLKDILLLGGGLSVPEIEKDFPSAGTTTPLGRSVVGVDINTGNILQTWDLLALNATIGPVAAGVVPTRVFLNSDLHQRAYFTDYLGGVWALGSSYTNPSTPLKDFLVDTSEMDKWNATMAVGGSPSLRKIYQDTSVNGVITTLPAPFVVGVFPVQSKIEKVSPLTVGVAFSTGNRNNPLDYYPNNVTPPSQHRFNVLFDRADAKVMGTDTSGLYGLLSNFTSQNDPLAAAIAPGNSSYYLNSTYGYYVNFPSATTINNKTFIPKGITESSVLSYVGFYSFFSPTSSDPCSGGQGYTNSFGICDIINPVVTDVSSTRSACKNGLRYTWQGVASNFQAVGTVAVIQAGMVVPSTPPPPGTPTTILKLQTLAGNPSEKYPRARTWRTVR